MPIRDGFEQTAPAGQDFPYLSSALKNEVL
jgi:hypothetical protein